MEYAVDITIVLPGFPKTSTSYYPTVKRDSPSEYEVDAWDYLVDKLGNALVNALENYVSMTIETWED